MFTCMEQVHALLQLYEMYGDGLITQKEWLVERQLLGYRTME